MTDKLAEKPKVTEPTNKPRKLAYRRPDLVVFGPVGALTKGGKGSLADGNHTTRTSDRTTKENIVKVGDHPLGIGLYLFDYKPQYQGTCGHGRQFGVMADEVETVMPEAVSLHPLGFKQVDYAMLGMSDTIH